MPLSAHEFAHEDENELFQWIKLQNFSRVRNFLEGAVLNTSSNSNPSEKEVSQSDAAAPAKQPYTNGLSNSSKNDKDALLQQQQQQQCCMRMIREQRDPFGNTPLHAALGFKAPDDILLTLIDIYPEATRCAGANEWLPVHIAAMYGSSAAVLQALVVHYPQGLDHTGQGGIKGRTPRHFSTRYTATNNPENRVLLERSTEVWESYVQQMEECKRDLLDRYIVSFNAGDLSGCAASLDENVQVVMLDKDDSSGGSKEDGKLVASGKSTLLPSYEADFKIRKQVTVVRGPMVRPDALHDKLSLMVRLRAEVTNNGDAPETIMELNVVYVYNVQTIKQLEHRISGITNLKVNSALHKVSQVTDMHD